MLCKNARLFANSEMQPHPTPDLQITDGIKSRPLSKGEGQDEGGLKI